MGRVKKARAEGEAAGLGGIVAPDPVPGDNGKALARIVEYFRATQPEAWEELRLCPLQHGLEAMAERLKG